jgi:hypothetical protein
MSSCSCWECKDKFTKWMALRHWPPVPPVEAYKPVEQEDADERATRVRRAQADERTLRSLRRELRAEKYEEIGLYLRRTVSNPKTVLRLEMKYRKIISRDSENWENV